MSEGRTFGVGYWLFRRKQPIPNIEGLTTCRLYERVPASSSASFRYLTDDASNQIHTRDFHAERAARVAGSCARAPFRQGCGGARAQRSRSTNKTSGSIVLSLSVNAKENINATAH